MEYTEIRFRPKGGGVWWGDNFREFAARAVGEAADSRVFARSNSPAQVTFVGSKTWVGIRAYGDVGNHIAALDTAKAVGCALDAHFGAAHRAELLTGEIEVTSERNARYSIRRLVLPRNRTRKHFDELMKASRGHHPAPDFIVSMLPDLVRDGIKEYLRDGAGISGIRLTDKPVMGTPIMVHGEPAFTVANLHFSTSLITGPIQVGSLRARGYGDVRRILGSDHD
jgi:hypothetical protein